MKTIAQFSLGALLLLAVAACANPSGQPWTPPPPASAAPESAAPESIAPESLAPASEPPASAAPSVAPASDAPASPAPASPAPATAAPSVAPSAASSGDPAGRTIALELDASLQIKENGVKITDIPVTPGETIIFQLTNTAGYIHNFWIGPDQALMTNQTTGLTGVADWSDAEPRELVWVVPEEVAGLKFGCTVPGHYQLMQGTFSLAS